MLYNGKERKNKTSLKKESYICDDMYFKRYKNSVIY